MFKQKQRDIVASIFILIGVCLVILAIISGITAYTAVYNESINTMRQQNRALVNRLEGWIELKKVLVENNAILLRDPNISKDTAIAYFIAQVQTLNDISSVYVGLPDGSIISSTEWDAPEYWYSPARPWYRAAAQRPGEVVFTPPYRDVTINQLAFATARTIGNYDDSLGVVSLNVPFTTMADYIAHYNEFDYSFSFILDYNGRILFHPDIAFTPIDDFTFKNINEIEYGRYIRMFETIRNEGFFVGGNALYTGILLSSTGWYVITRIPVSYIMGNVFSTLLGIVATVLFAIIALLGTWIMLRRVKSTMKREREAEERAKLLIDASPVACFLLDKNLQSLDCNQAAMDLLVKEPGKSIGDTYPEQEFLKACRYDIECRRYDRCGRNNCLIRKFLISNYRYIFPHYDQNKEMIENSMMQCCHEALKNGIKKFEFSSVTLYGKAIVCEVTIVPVNYQDGHSFAVYLRDLREEKRREVAEEESKAKTRFLARMSHEVRTPMNAVIGITEIQLQKSSHPLETEEAFLRIYSSSRLLLTIINDILDLSKVEAGRMEIMPAEYETANMIADTVQLNLMYIGSKRIAFGIDIDPRLPTHLIGDELRIKQILNNILSNAFKYTQEGKVSVSLSVEAGVEENSVVLIVSVSDSGYGMTKEQTDRLFDVEFTRFNLESNRRIEGSGLGMSIAYSLIKMMGGDIKVQSEPGKGSTFTAIIPQIMGSRHVLGKEAVESLRNLEDTPKYLKRIASMRHEPMPYGRVLIVDDVESNLYVIKGLLFPYKLIVETVESGFEAIAKIKEGKIYDIIFMDHMMPKMDGIEAAKIIRDMGYYHPIIALTANVIVGASQIFMKNGFSGFIAKPIDPYKLDTNLKRFIRDKQPEEVIKAAWAQYPHQIGETINTIPGNMEKPFLLDAQKALGIVEPLVLLQEMDSSAFKAYTIQVHALKSALYNMGRLELFQTASLLEQAGRNEDADTVRTQTPRFLENVREIVRELSSQKEAAVPAGSEDVPKTEIKNAEKTIFIVDDSLTNLTVAADALREQYTVMTIPSGKKTLALLEKVKPDLILLDIEMPEMDGFEVLRYLKSSEKFSDIPVIFLTATVDPQTEAKAFEMGVVGFITKPFSIPALLKHVADAL